MTGSILLYGATGYTGKLIAREARAKGASAVLAGRNPNMLKAVAKGLDLPWRSFDLADQKKVDAALKGVSVVLNAAGPFSATARPIADACLRQGPHYLDITGEIDVFEGLFARDAEAQRAGVTLMPGVGFDVVPSDCLAAHLKHRLPDATHLTIYLSAGFNVSRGTAKTAIEGIADGVRARRNGCLVTLARPDTGSCNFGKGLRRTIQIPWGDLSTAFHSTGIPNIEVHVEAPPALQALALTPAFVRSLLALPPAQAFLKALANRQPEGPSDEARCRARAGSREERQGRGCSHPPHNPGGLYADRPDQPRRHHARRRGRVQAGLSDAEHGLRPRLHSWLRRGDEGGVERVRRFPVDCLFSRTHAGPLSAASSFEHCTVACRAPTISPRSLSRPVMCRRPPIRWD